MIGSMLGMLIDLLPPEAQTTLGMAAAVSAVAGLFLWSAGIKVARVVVAVALGLAAAGLAAWGLPGVTGIAPLTAAIIGFVAGVLAGAVSFRVVQGAVLAACLAVGVMGSYYHWEVGRTKVAGASTMAATTMSADQLLIAVARLPENPAMAGVPHSAGTWNAARLSATAQAGAAAVQDWTMLRWTAMPAVHRQRMMALTLVTALGGLILALRFPRHVTWILTAALGTGLLVFAGMALMQVYAPKYSVLVPTRPAVVLVILAGVMGLGMLMQRLMFWPGRKKKAVEVLAVAVG